MITELADPFRNLLVVYFLLFGVNGISEVQTPQLQADHAYTEEIRQKLVKILHFGG